MSGDAKPDLGVNVEITLTSGGKATGYWDGLQWWVGVDGQPDDLPIVNGFVASWKHV